MATTTDNLTTEEAAANTNTNTTSTSTTTTSVPAYADPTRVAAIEDMYNKNLESTKAELKSSYDQNLSTLEENKSKLAQQYQTQKNQAATDYERQRRNLLETASASGLNVGTGAQARLAQNASYQSSRAKLNASEAEANASADKSIADLKIQYQNDINSAAAENDYEKAAALLEEYQTAYTQAMEKAQAQAQYGVFDGYADIYGQDTANQMAEAWAIQNPVLAYSLGRIDAAKYYQITGSWPPGYKKTSSWLGLGSSYDDPDSSKLGNSGSFFDSTGKNAGSSTNYSDFVSAISGTNLPNASNLGNVLR